MTRFEHHGHIDAPGWRRCKLTREYLITLIIAAEPG
jgi:hypothetical protein